MREVTRCCAFSGTTIGCKRNVHAKLCCPPALSTVPAQVGGSPSSAPSVFARRCWFMRLRWRAADSLTICLFRATAVPCVRVSHLVVEPQAHSGGAARVPGASPSLRDPEPRPQTRGHRNGRFSWALPGYPSHLLAPLWVPMSRSAAPRSSHSFLSNSCSLSPPF